MHEVYTPYWFLGVDAIFEIITMIVMLLIAYWSRRIYKLTGQKKYHFFSIAFFLASVAYLLKTLGDLAIFLVLKQGLTMIDTILSIGFVVTLSMLLFSTFILCAYIMLIIVQLKIDNSMVRALLFMIVFLTDFIVLSVWEPFVHIVASILLTVIVLSFYENYKKLKNVRSFAVFLAFTFILIAELLLIFTFVSTAFYAIGHTTLVIGSFILLFDLIAVLKK